MVSFDPLRPDQASVAKYDDAVRHAEHFVETVRNVDHADAARLHRAHGCEEPFDFVGRQARGRLVEHEKVTVDGERTGDRDERLFRAAQRLDARVGIDVAADQAEGVPRRPGASRPVDGAGPPKEGGAREATRKRDVLGHRHPFDEAEILMDESDGMTGVATAAVIGRAVEA